MKVHAYQDIALHERDEVLTAMDAIPRLHAYQGWLKLDKPQPIARSERFDASKIASDPLPTLSTWTFERRRIIEPGKPPHETSLTFSRPPHFRICHSPRPAGDESTSRLSQDLRHGTFVHPRDLREVRARGEKSDRGAAPERAGIHQ